MDSEIKNKADNPTRNNREDYKRLNAIYYLFTGLISLLGAIFSYAKFDIPFDIYFLAYWIGGLGLFSLLALISTFDNLHKNFAKWQLIFTIIGTAAEIYTIMTMD